MQNKNKQVNILIFTFLVAGAVIIATRAYERPFMPGGPFYEPKSTSKVEIDIKEIKTAPAKIQSDKIGIVEAIDVSKGTIREITMYNSLPEQTDDTPCISADGTNICEADYNVCASNAFPFGTRLYIDKLGECIVKDKMNPRYKERVDFYAGMDKERAINFGRQKLLVIVN